MSNFLVKLIDSITIWIEKQCLWFLRFSGFEPLRKIEKLTEEAEHRERLIGIIRQKNVSLIQLLQVLHDSGSDIDKIAFRCIGAIDQDDEVEAVALNRCLKLHQKNLIRLRLWQGKLVAEAGIDVHVEAGNAVELLELLVATGKFQTYIAEFPPNLRRSDTI